MDGNYRKMGGQAGSNSPKMMATQTNKLFLKGFHQEHAKMFSNQTDGTTGSGNQLL
jgi:hypothetical protein